MAKITKFNHPENRIANLSDFKDLAITTYSSWKIGHFRIPVNPGDFLFRICKKKTGL